MFGVNENQLKVALEQAIDDCLLEISEEISLPLIGSNVSETMATAALQVLLGIADAEGFLEEECLLPE